MKIIGRNLSGGVLTEMTLEEYSALIGAAITLAGLPALLVPGPRLAVPVVKAEGNPDLIIQKKSKSKIKVKKQRPLCQTCGKPVHGFGRYKYCSAKCSKQGKRKLDQGYRDQAAETEKGSINPADPLLTDEQRLAARLAMIKRSAEKIG